jgi:hypothetical protein
MRAAMKGSAVVGIVFSLAMMGSGCGEAADPRELEQAGAQTSELILPPIDIKDPVLLPAGRPGCADGTVEQSFAGGIVGCAGSVTYPNRKSLCAAGYHPLSAMVWRTSRGSTVPTHHYWTDDVLGFKGSGTGSCSAEYISGSACPANEPMRVCARTNMDPEGNRCNWFDCSFDSGGNTPNEFFGGCAGNATAGTLCVPDSGCADGSVEQTFTRGMVGCAGTATFANAAQLCTAGYTLGYESDWLRYRIGAVPTHNYWVASPSTHFSGSAAACVATTNASDPACPASSPMRVCVPSGLDPEGNRCNWTNCDSSSGYSTEANEHLGGCWGNTTAGAVCIPNKMCADGTMEQQWNRHLIGCAGNVSWGNRESLCGPRQVAIPASMWPSLAVKRPPTHNYWTSQQLLYTGSGSGSCSVSSSSGFSCGMDSAMHICTPSGTDPEGNVCNWTHCGLNTTADQFFGGCSATAGTLCMTGP